MFIVFGFGFRGFGVGERVELAVLAGFELGFETLALGVHGLAGFFGGGFFALGDLVLQVAEFFSVACEDGVGCRGGWWWW